MKILHLISSSGCFGAEKVVLTLAKAQRRQGLDVIVGVFLDLRQGYPDVAVEAKKKGIPVKEFVCKGKFDLKTALEIRKFLKKNNIDAVHAHNYKSNFYALFGSLYLKIRRLTTCHNWRSYGLKMRIYEWLDKLLLNRFNAIISVSNALQKEIEANIKTAGKVKFIGNGVDVSNYQKTKLLSRKLQVKRSFSMKEDDRLIGVVGRLTEEKGHLYLLKAFQKIIRSFPDVKLIIVGDGPLKESLKEKAQSLKIENNVIFTGMRNDIPDLLNLMDVFVLPSLDEGMPMAVLEAMAARKPIIATRVGAISGVIEDKREGILVPPGNEGELTDRLIELIEDKERARALGENAYAKVCNEFSAEKMAEQYLEVYNSVWRVRPSMDEKRNSETKC